MKYVVIEFEGHEHPFIFSEILKHIDVAQALLTSPYAGEVISAGLYDSIAGTWVCHGESVSLKVKSRESDAQLLQHALER